RARAVDPSGKRLCGTARRVGKRAGRVVQPRALSPAERRVPLDVQLRGARAGSTGHAASGPGGRERSGAAALAPELRVPAPNQPIDALSTIDCGASSAPWQKQLLMAGGPAPERLAALRHAVLQYKVAQAIARKQRPTGLWGGNLLGPVASKAHGWSEPGTVYQYRRLIELGWPPTERPFRVADRLLFQLLSRIEPDDPDRRSEE